VSERERERERETHTHIDTTNYLQGWTVASVDEVECARDLLLQGVCVCVCVCVCMCVCVCVCVQSGVRVRLAHIFHT